MLNKLLTISKYSSWDRCQGIGQGCNCAIMVRPGACRTFEEYSQQMFLPYITSQLEIVSREDIAWDHRRHSGTMQRQRMIAGVPIPANWEAFLRINANKD